MDTIVARDMLSRTFPSERMLQAAHLGVLSLARTPGTEPHRVLLDGVDVTDSEYRSVEYLIGENLIVPDEGDTFRPTCHGSRLLRVWSKYAPYACVQRPA